MTSIVNGHFSLKPVFKHKSQGNKVILLTGVVCL